MASDNGAGLLPIISAISIIVVGVKQQWDTWRANKAREEKKVADEQTAKAILQQQEEAARVILEAQNKKAEADALITKEILAKQDATHNLINGSQLPVLHLMVVATRRIADDHPDNAADVAAADEAQRAYDLHLRAVDIEAAIHEGPK